MIGGTGVTGVTDYGHPDRVFFSKMRNFWACTLIWNAQYCPTNNTIQANPYKSWGSGYLVDPSEKEQPLFGRPRSTSNSSDFLKLVNT